MKERQEQEEAPPELRSSPPARPLTPAHKALIALLAEQAAKEFLAEEDRP